MENERLEAALRARQEAWRRGNCQLVLDPQQREWHSLLWATPGDCVGMVARRRGKSFFAVSECCGLALKKPSAVMLYVAQTGAAAANIIEPVLAQVLRHCPRELWPEINRQTGIWKWPNGSQLHLAGTDNQQFRRLRGMGSDLTVLDEAGFYDDLVAVEEALSAQRMGTRGKMLTISSPAESPAHPFIQRYYAANAQGRSFHASIYDNPRLSQGEIQAFLANEADRVGLSLEDFCASTYCRREYFAEIVTEESRAAIPSFTPAHAQRVVVERQRPTHFDGYVGLDLGLIDGHGVLFAYWDFTRQVLVVEDELLLRGKATDILAEAVKQTETRLWGNTRFEGTLLGARDWANTPDWLRSAISETAPRQPYLRVADNLLLVLEDMRQRHGLAFFPTDKDEKHMAVDALNIAVRTGQVEIHPRCSKLVGQLYSTLWDKNRKGWERTADGHGELVDALVYLWRNVRKHRDPRPAPKVDMWAEHLPGAKPKGGLGLAAMVRRK